PSALLSGVSPRSITTLNHHTVTTLSHHARTRPSVRPPAPQQHCHERQGPPATRHAPCCYGMDRCEKLSKDKTTSLHNGLTVSLVGDILHGGPGHLYPPYHKGWRVKRKIVNRGGYYILHSRKSWGGGPWTT
ncbi:unnamed protein product, partial [Meganyctiphanes norvegica]